MAKGELRSISTSKILHLLSEGVVEGPASVFYQRSSGSSPGTIDSDTYIDKAMASTFFDDTPVANSDGSYNFEGVMAYFREGYASQALIPGFPTAESSFGGFNDEITPTASVTKSTSENDVDALRITIGTQAFFTSTKKGKTRSASASLKVDVSEDGTNWTLDVKTITLNGYTLSGYEESHRIERPGTSGTWYVRIRRIDEVKNEARHKNQVFFKSYVEIKDVKETYPDSSLLALQYDAETTGGAFPKTDIILAGIKVKVPNTWVDTIFNADGTVSAWGYYKADGIGTKATTAQQALDYWIAQGAVFLTKWSNDPAWVLRDIITNNRYGVGEFIKATSVDDVSFIEYSFYNTETIDDGGQGNPGDVEPRFTFNGVFQKQESAKKVLQSLCSASRSFLMNTGSVVKVIQDRPTAPVEFITNASVIDGEFTYSSDDLEQTTTFINVTFNDKNDRYLPKTVSISNYVWDSTNKVFRRLAGGESLSNFNTAIEKFGLNKDDLAAFATTSESQALRQAHWVLDTALNSPRKVRFKTGMIHCLIEPGDVVEISDILLTQDRLSSVVSSASTTSITLALPITLQNSTYTLHVLDPVSQVVVERTINETNGSFSTITFSALNNAPLKNQRVGLQGATSGSGGVSISPQQYRIISVKEDDKPGIYSIEGVQFDPNKFTRVENNIVVPSPVFSPYGGQTISAPGSATFTPEAVVDAQGNIISRKLTVDWVDSNDPLIRGYEVKWSIDNKSVETSGIITQSIHSINPAEFGIYTFSIYAYNLRGIRSRPLNVTYDFSEDAAGLTTTLSAMTNLIVQGGGTEFSSKDLHIEWTDPNNPGDPLQSILKDYQIEIQDPNTSTVLRTAHTTETKYTYSFTLNEADFGTPSRSIQVAVYGRDANLRLTTAIVQTFTNSAPALPTGVSYLSGITFYRLQHNDPVESDAVGTKIWHSTTSGFTPSSSNLVAKNDEMNFTNVSDLESGETYYVRFAVYDTFGADESDLNISAEQVVTLASVPQVVVPDDITGIVVTTSVTNNESFINISWDASANAEEYEVEVSNSTTGAFDIYETDALSVKALVKQAKTYNVRVRGRNEYAYTDWFAYASNPIIAVSDTTAPSAPTLNSVSSGFESVHALWSNPLDDDFDLVEIFHNNMNDSATAVSKGTVRGTVGFVDNLTNGNTAYIWLKAIDTSGNKSGFSNMMSATVEGLSAGIITETHIANNSISTPKLQAGSIIGSKIAAQTITGNNIAAGTITAAQIAADTITAGNIAANAITASELAANAVTTTHMSANSINGDRISTNTLHANRIVSNSITATQIATRTISADRIVSGAITANELSTGTLITSSGQIGNATITDAKITSLNATKISGDIVEMNGVMIGSTSTKYNGPNHNTWYTMETYTFPAQSFNREVWISGSYIRFFGNISSSGGDCYLRFRWYNASTGGVLYEAQINIPQGFSGYSATFSKEIYTTISGSSQTIVLQMGTFNNDPYNHRFDIYPNQRVVLAGMQGGSNISISI